MRRISRRCRIAANATSLPSFPMSRPRSRACATSPSRTSPQPPLPTSSAFSGYRPMTKMPFGDRRVTFAVALLLAALTFGSAPAAFAQRLYDDFVLSVANDRAGEVKGMLARGMDPDTVDRNGDPVLLVAARNGFRSTAEALLAAHADANRANRFGDTPIMVAALNGHLDVVRLLRERGAALE